MSALMRSWMLSWWVLSQRLHHSGVRESESDTCGGTFVLLTAQELHSLVIRNGMKQNRFHPC